MCQICRTKRSCCCNKHCHSTSHLKRSSSCLSVSGWPKLILSPLSLASMSLFILFIYFTKTSGISLQFSANLLDYTFMLPAECDMRLSQLTNITFSLPHLTCCHYLLHCDVIADVLSNAGVIVIICPTQVITCNDQRPCQQRTWAHKLSDYKSRLVMVN